MLDDQRLDWISRQRFADVGAFAVEPAQHGVDELARAESVTALGELDGLRDGRVRRHAAHVQQLVGTGAEQIGEIGIEPRESATDAFGEQ